MPETSRPTWLTLKYSGPDLQVIEAPGVARNGPITALVSAFRHSELTAKRVLDAFEHNRPIQNVLPPVACAAAVHDARAGTLTVVTGGSAGIGVAYSTTGDTLILSTSLKATVNLLPIRPELDERVLACKLFLIPESKPPFIGVEAIGAGMRLEARIGAYGLTVRTTRWFDLESEILRGSVDDLVEQCRITLEECVAAVLPESGDVSALMSGGLDSTLVVATAAQLMGPDRRINAMCLDPLPDVEWQDDPRPVKSDLADAQLMGERWPNVDVVPLRNTARLTPLDTLPARFEETYRPPIAPGNSVWIDQARLLGSGKGHDVLLTGQSGNATVSWTPPDVWGQLLLQGRWVSLASGLREDARARNRGMKSQIRRLATSTTRANKILDLAFDYVHPRTRRTRKELRSSHLSAMLAFAAPGVVERYGLYTAMSSAFAYKRYGLNREEQIMGALDPNFESHYGDILTVDPLGAEPIIRFCFNLPNEVFIGYGAGRSLARRLMVGRVPQKITLRVQRGAQGVDRLGMYIHSNRAVTQLSGLTDSPAADKLIEAQQVSDCISAQSMLKGENLGSLERALAIGYFASWWCH